MRRTIFIAALALLLLPATAVAGPNKSDRARAVQDCNILKESMGRALFKQTYGQRAFARCVRQMTAEEHENRLDAVAECRAEHAADPEGFRETYGSDRNGANAFGKCVSSKRRSESREDRREVRNAAKDCKAELAEMGAEEFRAHYGKNENGANAFGKCVSSKVKEQDGDDENGDGENGDEEASA